jgi:hypothetical protein
MLAFLLVLAQSTTDEGGDAGPGLLAILGIILAIVVAVAAVWTFTAKRAGRTPRRETHEHDIGRSSR